MKRSHEVMVAAEDASMTSEGSGSVVASTPVVQHVLIKDHDLLPKVLGFVLDSKNYFVLSSVCRAWKRGILEEMEPPFLDEMARLSLQHDENGTPIPPQVALPLFKQALVTLQYRDSKIYRGQEKKNNTNKPPTSSSTRQKKLVLLPLTETEGSVSFTKWPSLMPRSHVTLSYFFWIICLQETTALTTTTNPSLPPHDHDQQLQQQQLQHQLQQQQQQSYYFTDRLYEITKDFIERLFRVNMEHCATALLREGRNVEPLLQLAKLVAIWRRLRGISKIVIGMTNNYFDKFYYNNQQHHHHHQHHVGLVPQPHEQEQQQQPKLVVVPTIQEIADRALLVSLDESFSDSTSWDKTTSEATSRLDIVMEQVLKEIATEESGRAFLEHLPLLEKSCEACEGLRAMLERHTAAVAAALAVAVEDEQEPAACFSVTTSESIIQMCTRISAALRPVIEAMKKVVVVVVENEDMGAALLEQQS